MKQNYDTSKNQVVEHEYLRNDNMNESNIMGIQNQNFTGVFK